MRPALLAMLLVACGGVRGPRQVQTSFASFDVSSAGVDRSGTGVEVLALDTGRACDLLVVNASPRDTRWLDVHLEAAGSDTLAGLTCAVGLGKEGCRAAVTLGLPEEDPLVHPGLAGTVRVRQDDPGRLLLDVDVTVSRPALDLGEAGGAVAGESLQLTLVATPCN